MNPYIRAIRAFQRAKVRYVIVGAYLDALRQVMQPAGRVSRKKR
jgi:hypothetical protein